MSFEAELHETLTHVGAALDAVGVSWAIGGSFASTIHGEPRATNDVDFVANLRAQHISPFVRALGSSFYADERMIREAITRRDSCNVIDERSYIKVDIFVPGSGPLGENQLLRRRAVPVGGSGASVFILSPEDTVLQKLRWFELGGRVSDRQWRDIISILRIQTTLDDDYMREVAATCNLAELLGRAKADAG